MTIELQGVAEPQIAITMSAQEAECYVRWMNRDEVERCETDSTVLEMLTGVTQVMAEAGLSEED